MDTIGYRIHNLDRVSHQIKHEGKVLDVLFWQPVIDALGQYKGKGKAAVERSPELEHKAKLDHAIVNEKLNILYFFNYSQKVYTPSHTMDINIFQEPTMNSLRFEFSAPKMYFGNNVCELLPSLQTSLLLEKSMTALTDFWYKQLYNIFQEVINKLTNHLQTSIIWNDIEVYRIDIAYNQIHKSYADKMSLLDAQKKAGAKRIKDIKFNPDLNGLWYQTENYHFKIYCKYADFQQHFPDLQKRVDECIKEKKKVHPNVYKTIKERDRLSEYAKRLLRYELECTHKTMSMVYNSKLKKKYLPHYWKIYNHLKRIFNEYEDEQILLKTQIRFYDGKNYYTQAQAEKLQIEKPFQEFRCIYFTNEKSEAQIFIKINAELYYPVIKEQSITRIKSIFNSYKILCSQYGYSSAKQMKEVWKFFNSEQTRHHRFFLGKKPKDINDHPELNGNILQCAPNSLHFYREYMETEKDIHFSKELLSALINTWYNQFFKQFQFAEFPDDEAILKAVRNYNAKVELLKVDEKGYKMKKVRESRIKLLHAYLKSGNRKELQKDSGYDRSTVYRLMKDLSKILNLEKHVQISGEIKHIDCIKDMKILYQRHYDMMLNSESPLNEFLITKY